jgi:histone H3/H4
VKQKRKKMNDEYANELSKQAIARACAALGIKNIRMECLEALSDVIQHYVKNLAQNTVENAELSGRAVAGIQDVIPALEHVVRFFFFSLLFIKKNLLVDSNKYKMA